MKKRKEREKNSMGHLPSIPHAEGNSMYSMNIYFVLLQFKSWNDQSININLIGNNFDNW